jgi:hypothetical protein
MSPRVLCTLLVLVAVITGCSTTSRIDDPPTSTPGLKLLEELDASGSVAAESLYPVEPGEVLYEVLPRSEGEEPARIMVSAKRTNEFEADLAVARGEERTEFLAVRDDGVIVMTASIEHAKNALTLFDPPLEIAPAELEPGDPFEAESSMRVVDAKDRKSQRESGTATRTIEYVSDERIETALGEFRAARVEVTFKADLQLADAETHEIYWVVADRGVIAQRRSETVRVFGLGGEPKRRTLVRLGQ